MKLSDISIHAWLQEYKIKNEKGDPIDFRDHMFLFDIYRDNSQNLVVIKAAQVGMSTLEVLKTIYDAKRNKMDIIYTLPTDNDVNIFVGGKVNRIIAQNPILLEYTKDKDSIEQKQIGDSMIYFRGTWTKKAAIMVTADRVTHDEKDSSKQDVINDYQARLQHSKFKQKHVFSHPSTPGTGVDVEWQMSDQKHWFIKCSHCNEWQYMSWNLTDPSDMSIDMEKEIYVCKLCKGEIFDDDRRRGKWVRKFKDMPYSGYWVPFLICPWVTAKDVINKYNDPDTTEEFFYNKVLGLPYLGKGNKLTMQQIMQNVTADDLIPSQKERSIMGVDTGLKLDYVIGGEKGLYYHGEAKDYDELDKHMRDNPEMIAIVDGGGDLIGSRKFKEKWPGRVFLCFLGGEKSTTDESRWNDEERMVSVDRNKYIQLLVDEFSDAKIPLMGSEDDWYSYYLDWNNLHRIKVTDPITGAFKGFKWVRSGRDHKALATVNWRVGMTRFGRGKGKVIGESSMFKTAPQVLMGERMTFTPQPDYGLDEEYDWRKA